VHPRSMCAHSHARTPKAIRRDANPSKLTGRTTRPQESHLRRAETSFRSATRRLHTRESGTRARAPKSPACALPLASPSPPFPSPSPTRPAPQAAGPGGVVTALQLDGEWELLPGDVGQITARVGDKGAPDHREGGGCQIAARAGERAPARRLRRRRVLLVARSPPPPMFGRVSSC
jgi:hypothetical protein